ncbi:hypothetical protein BDDG_03969 [Blastomyces dermatitidis ATCC 18188]|uniref:Uncharacterized protein n=1 Tax=Ajellomyces dermatitidis (strain ATCC 18188 / CBS 674.68) TaxID=653446 RepID=F2TCR5_AJEDA|nr:hypothetical protein BDDG_03969 [Blastomyces dermatitidis ATCC 18188]
MLLSCMPATKSSPSEYYPASKEGTPSRSRSFQPTPHLKQCNGPQLPDLNAQVGEHGRKLWTTTLIYTVLSRALIIAYIFPNAQSVLYQFFRETTCDIRDIAEDTEDGMKTLPVRLGEGNTMLLMSVVGMFFDVLLTGGVGPSLQVAPSLAFQSVVRVGCTMCVYSQILRYPRENYWAWGLMSMLGLVPVLPAQLCLLNSR